MWWQGELEDVRRERDAAHETLDLRRVAERGLLSRPRKTVLTSRGLSLTPRRKVRIKSISVKRYERMQSPL